MSTQFIKPISKIHPPQNSGEKSNNLHYLQQKGFTIPLTYSISWELQNAFHKNGDRFPDSFCDNLEKLLDPNKAYAVRSSANVEDSKMQSYAGQFLSLLNVRGLNNVLTAIRTVWESSLIKAPISYQLNKKLRQDEIKMGVVLQEMIIAECAGVAFSCNPVTGMDEIVIEAVEGSSVALLQDGKTPFRWIWKWGKWLEQPATSPISEEIIKEVALTVRKVSLTCGYPVDIEWVFDGKKLFLLQMRAITALNHINIYANHIAKEVLPGYIKPLVWSVNVPLVNGAWIKLLTELIGKNRLDPYLLAKSFFGYAYFNMGLLGSVFKKIGLAPNSLERLMGFKVDGDNGPSFRPSIKAILYLPRIIFFLVKNAWFARKFETFCSKVEMEYDELENRNLNLMSNSELITHISSIFIINQKTAYFNILTPLIMRIFHYFAKNNLSRSGVDYERVNWLDGWNERSDYDPLSHLYDLGVLYNTFSSAEKKAIFTSNQPIGARNIEAFHTKYNSFLKRFGHFSDSGTDFSFPLWRETPEVLIKLISSYREKSLEGKRETLSASMTLEVSDTFFETNAKRYSRFREQISFLFTRGISLFRGAYKKIGENFYKQDLLCESEDIFFLEHQEIISATNQKEEACHYKELVEKRKNDQVQYKSISLPPVIYGDDLPSIIDQTTSLLNGIPTSRGLYRGVVCVVKGISDFSKVTTGCVLVIPYSDVSWIPLFAHAGALIAESGGMLSHSSIIAREYCIPAIVSVSNATQLVDGTEVTVDGYSGVIVIHNNN